MKFLSFLRLRIKLTLLLCLSVLALVVSLGVAVSLTRQRMLDDRVDKLRADAQSTAGTTYTALKHVADAKLARDLFHIDRAMLVDER